MEATIKSENALRAAAMKLLIEGLGAVNAERFINCIKTDHFDCMRRVHTKGMYPETNTLPKQPYPAGPQGPAGLVDYTEWQRDLWNGKTIEELHNEAAAFYAQKHGS